MIIVNQSPRAHNLFIYGHQLPTIAMPYVAQVAVSGINVDQMYQGQTEPPVVVLLRGGWRLGLNDADYDFEFYAQVRNGANIVTGAVAVLSFVPAIDGEAPPDAMDPVLSYTQTTGFAAVTGVQHGQFRVIRSADSAIMFINRFPMRRFPAV